MGCLAFPYVHVLCDDQIKAINISITLNVCHFFVRKTFKDFFHLAILK